MTNTALKHNPIIIGPWSKGSHDHIHPNTTKNTWVSPIKDVEDINKLKTYLLSHGRYAVRNYTIFVFGINSGLRCGDIVSLKVWQVYNPDGTVRDQISVHEEKTGKRRYVTVNNTLREALEKYSRFINFKRNYDTAYLFPSQRKQSKIPYIDRDSFGTNVLKPAAEAVGITYNVNTHSMRKTWAYHYYMHGSPELSQDQRFHLLQKALNHVNSRETLCYIGIEPKDVSGAYTSIEL